MGRVLAIDYGRKRIGVAYSDPGRIIVSHSEAIEVNGKKDAIGKLTLYISANEIDEVVIGYPIREDGERGELCEEIDLFCEGLKSSLPGVVFRTLDERYTSVIATGRIHAAGGKVGDNKGRVDAGAAEVLLGEYLDRGKG